MKKKRDPNRKTGRSLVRLYIAHNGLFCLHRHVPKRSIIHTFVLQRNGDFIYLLLSVECFNRWWIIFNGNVLGSPRYGASAHALLITRLKMRHPTPGIGGLRTWKHYKDYPIFMERCDEKNKYTLQWSIAKYTRAAANIFITRKEKMRDGKPYCQSQPCICTASHPGVRTTKIHRCYSIKLFQNWADFHVVLKHLGAYAPSWPVWHCLGAKLHADRSRRHSLIATWAFVRTSWGSQVFIQSPSIPPEIRCCRTRRSTSA